MSVCCFYVTSAFPVCSLASIVLAAQLGKQLLEQNSALETRLEALESAHNELQHAHEHVVSQHQAAANELSNAEKQKTALFAQVDDLHAQVSSDRLFVAYARSASGFE